MTLKIWEFECDLRPLKANSCQKYFGCLKAYIINSYSIFDFIVLWVSPWPLTFKSHLGSKKVIPFESPYMTSYLTSMDNISLSHTIFEIFDFKVLRVWPWPLTPKSHLGSNYFIPFESSYMISYLNSMDVIYPSRTVFEIFDVEVFRVWPWPSTPKGHLRSKKFIPFESPSMTSYLTSMDNISLSHTVFEIFDVKVFKVWPWPLTPKGYLGSKNVRSFESPYMTSYLTSMDNISLSGTVFEIFNFKVLRVWPWPLTPEGKLGSKKLYRSKAHIWLPIWLLWTTSLYLLPLSRYSTSKFLGFDLDLRPLKVNWGQKMLYHSKARIWLPIWLLWTTSLYLVPFQRYSTSKFLGFDLDLWPLKVIWGQKNLYRLKAYIWLPIWLLWTTSLYLLPFSRYSTSKFLGFDLDLWPLEGVWGQTISYHSKAHIWLPIWLLWTTSLYLVPFQRYSTSKFLGFDLDLWPLKVIWGQKNLNRSKAHIWLPIWLLWTTSLYLVPFSRYSTSKFLGFDLDLWPLKVIWGQKSLHYSKARIWLSIWLLWTTSLYLVPFSRYSTSKFLGFDLDLWPLKVIWGQKMLYHSKAHI